MKINTAESEMKNKKISILRPSYKERRKDWYFS